jgi:hypothetical protein
MMMTQRRSKYPPPKFRVGERVTGRFGWESKVFEIIEDRGNIGAGGRRWYTIKDLDSIDEPFDFPEESLQPLPPGSAGGTSAGLKS